MSEQTQCALCVVLLFLVAVSSAQTNSDAPPSSTAPTVEASAPNSQSDNSSQGASGAQLTPPVAQTPQGQQAAHPMTNGGDGLYVFKAEVQEVVLHATVVDEHHKAITDLQRDAFRVFDSGKPQHIELFRREDVPVAMAIVIDNSGSMRDKRLAVNSAALNLVRASNPRDEVCVVNFNNDSFLDQDYTADIGLLKDALEHIESRGGTALYDALVATSDHLMKSAKLSKKVILVVTDGEDNASHDTLQHAARALSVDGGPAIYSIGVLGHEKEEKRARRALQLLSDATGGAAFFPANLKQVDTISQQIAHEIRNQYTIGYRPSTSMQPGTFHPVSVRADAKGYKGLTVRTRSGYYVQNQRAAPSSLAPRNR